MTERYVILLLMKKTIAALFAVILAAAAPLGASAEEWNTMGPRAMGMGGAGVALSQGPLASYWNPAALGRATENAYGFSAPVSVHGALTGPVLAGANDLKNANNSCPALIAAGNTAACQSQINVALGELSNPTDGLRVDGSAAGDFKIGKLAFFANDFVFAGAVPRVDNVDVQTAGTPQTNPLNFGNNKSELIVKGASILEFGAGYGHELPWVPGLFVGGDLKVMRAQVGYTTYGIIQNSDKQSNIFSNMRTGAVTSANVGVDAGALWDVNKTIESAWWSPKVGVTGRNLNNPKFSQPAAAAADGVGGRYAVNPQARLGLAITPLHFWNIAADLDLTRNLTPVDGVASRQLGLGTEVNVFNRSWINIPLRFGMARNLETGTNMLTAGAGINLLHLIIDFAGEASPKRIDTQTQGSNSKLPQEFGASVALSILFGGSEDERTSPRPAVDEQPVPSDKVMIPKASSQPPAAAVDQTKANAAKAQSELDQQAKPAKSGQ
jgi:hypothetical protein